ncbi:MAG: hypothetical protein HY268_18425 [Deltaproteobacteria bacterium]|nr:hypothetical protein [Deltaproteobacteria bacterium]
MSRLWHQQGKKEEARQLLAEIYTWFTEGFDTKDLQDAAALLIGLGGSIEEPQSQQVPEHPSAGRKTHSPISITTFPPAAPHRSAELHLLPDCLFRNEGEYWTLTFQGTLCRVKDSRGMPYLAQLLKNPTTEFHALALVRGSANPQEDEPATASSERARVNVTRAIRAAIKKITASHPTLGQHLIHAIKTGTFCSYTPDPHQPYSWQV